MKKTTKSTTQLIVCLGLLLSSCHSGDTSAAITLHDEPQEQLTEEEVNQETERDQALPETDPVSKSFLETCQAFYDHVCMHYSSPDAILNGDGYYELNLVSYKNSLRSLNIFTDAFIEYQDELFSECRDALIADSITPEDAVEGIDMSAPIACDFFHYAYYFQAQDRPDGFQLQASRIAGNSGYTEMHYYTGTGENYFSWDNLIVLKIELKKFDDTWLITAVQKVTSP